MSAHKFVHNFMID